MFKYGFFPGDEAAKGCIVHVAKSEKDVKQTNRSSQQNKKIFYK